MRLVDYGLYGRFYGRSAEIDRPVGRQKSTATDRLRPTANTIKESSLLQDSVSHINETEKETHYQCNQNTK